MMAATSGTAISDKTFRWLKLQHDLGYRLAERAEVNAAIRRIRRQLKELKG